LNYIWAITLALDGTIWLDGQGGVKRNRLKWIKK